MKATASSLPTRRAVKTVAKRVVKPKPEHDHDHDYSALLTSVCRSFSAIESDPSGLFMTDAVGLYHLYLDSLPGERQVHDCHCCRRFIETYGGLVVITNTGALVPAMWDPVGVPSFYGRAFARLQERVEKAQITGVFRTEQTTWGTPSTPPWSHLAVTPPAKWVHRGHALTGAHAAAAGKLENFKTVAHALTEFNPPTLNEALRILKAEALRNSEKFVAPVQWLRDLHDRPKGRKGVNVLWRAIATAPEGYCHPRGSVTGTLLEDIAAGLPFAAIKARFDAKLGPLAYQRPKAAPSVGNIKAAEALVQKLGIEPSLERRFARLEELELLWAPRGAPRKPAAGGVFGHLKPKGAPGKPAMFMPAVTMTWEKFARTVLPDAEQIEFAVPQSGRFIALTTAVHEDAPPILKWDRELERNPVAWYVYPSGSSASQWGLRSGSWAKLTGITPFPNLWGTVPMPYMGEGVVLVIEGAADSRGGGGNALFPVNLREELHGARSTIEAYSRNAELSGRAEATACGYDVRKGQGQTDCVLRVTAFGAATEYKIDRWD